MLSPTFHTLTEALLAAPPSKPFITMWNSEDDCHTASFGQFIKQAQAHAANFHSHNLRTGDKIVLIMPQGIPLMAAFAGAMLLGAAPAILPYPNFKVEPAKYASGLSGVTANLKARLIVVDESFPEELLQHVCTGQGEKLLRFRNSFPVLAEEEVPAAPVESDQLAFIQHSAGTTGLQKGVALSHAAVLAQLKDLGTALSLNDRDRIYSWLPLYHDMGLIACFMLPMVFHLPVVMQSPMDWVMQPGSMLRLISEYHCTLSWVPNFTLQFLARRVPAGDGKQFDLSCLRALINSAEPVRAQSMDEFEAAFSSCGLRPGVLQSSYGMAENVLMVTQSGLGGERGPRRVRVENESYRNMSVAVPVERAGASSNTSAISFVSSGRCLPGNEIRIVSPTGEDKPEGGVGEILVRSDSLFEGYINRPDLTAKVLKEGWFWSGDLGFCLDGDLFVVGRRNDLIIVAGRNIYPQDLEEIVSSHPAIRDGRAVAFGLYNPDLGTEEIIIVAEVQQAEDLRNSAAIEQEIRSAVMAEFSVSVRAIYLKPCRWIVKSTAGKAARSATREKLVAEHPDLVPHSIRSMGAASDE